MHATPNDHQHSDHVVPSATTSHDDIETARYTQLSTHRQQRRNSLHLQSNNDAYTRTHTARYNKAVTPYWAHHHDPLPDVFHKRRKRETQSVTRGMMYYNNEVDFYQLLGLQEVEKAGHTPDEIRLFSPFFTEKRVLDALTRIRHQNNGDNNATIRVYASQKTIANNNLGKDHMQRLVNNGIPVFIINELHAKAAYIAYYDASGTRKTRSIMGSANITQPGFKRNVDSWMVLPHDIEHDFYTALENISRNAWQYRGPRGQNRQRQERHKQIRPVTPEHALLETYSNHINAQIAQSIDNTQTGDTIMVNTFSCDDPVFIQALQNAHARGVIVDVCIHKESHMPHELVHNNQENNNEVSEIAYNMNCTSLYHDKTVCIERGNRSYTTYYTTGNRSKNGESEANLAYVTKNPRQTQSILDKMRQKARKYLPHNNRLNIDTHRNT